MGTHKVTCNFCSMQDTLILSFNDLFSSVHYNKSSSVRGFYETGERRVCPRGNFCIELAQHKLRTSYACVRGEQATTKNAMSEIVRQFANVDTSKVAILLSSSLPLEDAFLTAKLANKLGTKFVAQISHEDDISAKFLNKFSFADLKEQQVIVAIGDIFSLHPTIARSVHDARFADRKNIFAVIDNCQSRTSRFAWCSLIAKPGKTGELVEALAKTIAGEKCSVDGTGVDVGNFERLVSSLRDAEKSTILFSPGVARFSEPLRIGYWAKKIAESKQFNFAAMGTGSNGRGISRLLSAFGFASTNEVVKAIASDSIETLLCLNCDPIEAFPALYEHIKKIPNVAATTTLPTAIYQVAGVTIPSMFIFERTGTMLSLTESLFTLNDPLPSPNYPGEPAVLSALLKHFGENDSVSVSDIQQKLDEFNFIADAPEPYSISTAEIVALGYNIPHHHGDGSYTRQMSWVKRFAEKHDNTAIIGAKLAEKMGLKDGDAIVVQTDTGKSEFTTAIEKDQTDGIVLVPAYMPNGRAIFGWCPIGGFIPAVATISKP